MTIMTIKEIAKILKSSENKIRTWLGGYRFEKYRVPFIHPLQYDVCEDFWQDFYDFLELKYVRNLKTLKNIPLKYIKRK